MKKTGLYGYVSDFSIDCKSIDVADVLDIHKYSMIKNDIKLIKHVFITLLSFSGSLATKCVSYSNETCVIRPNIIDLNLVELNYNPFIVSPEKYSRSC